MWYVYVHLDEERLPAVLQMFRSYCLKEGGAFGRFGGGRLRAPLSRGQRLQERKRQKLVVKKKNKQILVTLKDLDCFEACLNWGEEGVGGYTDGPIYH